MIAVDHVSVEEQMIAFGERDSENSMNEGPDSWRIEGRPSAERLEMTRVAVEEAVCPSAKTMMARSLPTLLELKKALDERAVSGCERVRARAESSPTLRRIALM